MNEWTAVITVALLLGYLLATQWLDSRSDSSPHQPDANDTLVEHGHRDDARDDGERRIPDIQLGFQRENR